MNILDVLPFVLPHASTVDLLRLGAVSTSVRSLISEPHAFPPPKDLYVVLDEDMGAEVYWDDYYDRVYLSPCDYKLWVAKHRNNVADTDWDEVERAACRAHSESKSSGMYDLWADLGL